MSASHFSGPVYSNNGFYGPTYTYATLPAATSVAAGTQLWTTDKGWYTSNGAQWSPNTSLSNNSLNGQYLQISPQSQTGVNSTSASFNINLITATFTPELHDDVVTNLGYNITGGGYQIAQPDIDPFCFGFQFESNYDRLGVTSTITSVSGRTITDTSRRIDRPNNILTIWSTGGLVGYGFYNPRLASAGLPSVAKIISNTPNSLTIDRDLANVATDTYSIIRTDMEWFRIMNAVNDTRDSYINCRWDSTTVDKVSAIQAARKRAITGVSSNNPTVFTVAAGDNVGLWGNNNVQFGIALVEFITTAEDPTLNYPGNWSSALFSGGKPKTLVATYVSDTTFSIQVNSTGFTSGLNAKFRTMPLFDSGGLSTVSTTSGQGYTFSLPVVGAPPGDDSNMCVRFEPSSYTFAAPTAFATGTQIPSTNGVTNGDVNLNLKSTAYGLALFNIKCGTYAPSTYGDTQLSGRFIFSYNDGNGNRMYYQLFDAYGSNPQQYIDLQRTGPCIFGNANASSTSLVGATSSVKADATGVTLTLGSAATLLKTATTLTDYKAAATATLTNAPKAGNPTKWIAINDNGTTLYIPAW